MRVFRCRMRVFRCRMRVFRCRMRVFRCRLRVFRCRMRVFRCRLRVFRVCIWPMVCESEEFVSAVVSGSLYHNASLIDLFWFTI